MTHLSLFSGIGGLDLAAEWAGFETVGQCEFADYPTKVLEKHWPNVPRWKDIRTLTGESFYERTRLHTVDLISGGFPCQPFSVAGKQKGKGDDRYLWPEMLRVIRELKPRWVLGENVPGILRIAADDVCKDLEREGYDIGIFDYEAAAVGAPHRRERVFFVANCNGTRLCKREYEIDPAKREQQAQPRSSECGKVVAYSKGQRLNYGNDGENKQQADREIDSSTDASTSCGAETVADTKSQRLQGYGTGWEQITNTRFDERKLEGCRDGCYGGSVESELGGGFNGLPGELDELGGLRNGVLWPALAGEEQYHWEASRTVKGIKNRVDRLKCLGNAVVPAQVYPILRAIVGIERRSI